MNAPHTRSANNVDIPMIRILTSIAIAMLAGAAHAETAGPCKDGALATIRTSKITGAKATFDEAVKDQADWYAARGSKDRIVLVDLITKDKDKKAPDSISVTEAMTIHYYAGNVKAEVEHDDAWKAFVAKFRASSEVTSELVACLPK